MKPKILVTGRLPDELVKRLAEACDIEANREDRPMEMDAVLASIADKDGLLSMITDRVDDDLMGLAPRLRIISQMAVGYNNIDVGAATRRGIPVTNTPGVLTDATAELAFALLLAAARRVAEGDKMVREGRFLHWAPFLFLGSQVSGKTLGIVGMGRIGKAVAKRARGFDMKIIYHNPKPLDAAEEGRYGAQFRNLDALLAEADFVSLHVPLTEKTKHLIGEKQFAMMKKTAFLINTSRGPVVNEKDLVEALRSGAIAGAGIDVYENEPALEPGLSGMENAVLLPHVGSGTLETRTKMAEMAVESLLIGLSGKVPPRLVNPEVFRKK
jgi:glyoxylate reductase